MQEKKEAAAAQAMPINCASAPGDLRALNSEKASTASKIGNGISMIAPIGLSPVGHGTEKTKYQVTTGDYNKALDTKIGEIKAAWGFKQMRSRPATVNGRRSPGAGTVMSCVCSAANR